MDVNGKNHDLDQFNLVHLCYSLTRFPCFVSHDFFCNVFHDATTVSGDVQSHNGSRTRGTTKQARVHELPATGPLSKQCDTFTLLRFVLSSDGS